MNKLSINNFYVGELYLNHHPANLDDITQIEKYGAIPLSQEKIGYEDYTRLYSIFYKIDEHSYLCLHDEKIYPVVGYGIPNFCQSMMPLQYELPALGFESPCDIFPDDAIRYFNLLVQKGMFYSSDKLYSHAIYSTDQFYLGNLTLLHKDKNGYCNVSERLKLLKNGAKVDLITKGDSSFITTEELFYVPKDLSHPFKYGVLTSTGYGDDLGDDSVLFTDALEKAGISYTSPSMSIPTALKLYRSLNKKRK